jgi:hypothetical protein
VKAVYSFDERGKFHRRFRQGSPLEAGDLPVVQEPPFNETGGSRMHEEGRRLEYVIWNIEESSDALST